MKKYISVLAALVCAVLIVVIPNYFLSNNATTTTYAENTNEESILPQNVVGVLENPEMITKIYDAGKLLGVIKDETKIDALLEDVYKEKYATTFPDSSLDIGKDLYMVSELSYYVFDDIDDEICAFLKEKDLFTIEVTSVEFANDGGVYAQIYVQNPEIYQEAINHYLSFFIDEDSLNTLSNNGEVPPLKTYGSRNVGISIPQTITTKTGYATPDVVMTSEEQILDYLKYGENTDREYYTVKQYDTVQGVGSKNYGLSAEQIMNINDSVIKSTDQVLSEGQELCVTYFTSPIDVIVTKESMKKEAVYPSGTIYREDPTLREGELETEIQPQNGSQNSLYEEQWTNGVLVSGNLISSVVTTQPIQEVVRVGTYVIPGVGTGTFRWPVDNPYVSCRWGCYAGHRAIDIQNAYDHYGPIYAADRGTIEVNAYNSINGNYVIIDHGNGYETYYGHMNVPSPLEVGTIVDKGDYIGQLGMTGTATGPHTHFFIMYNGERYDPCNGFLSC